MSRQDRIFTKKALPIAEQIALLKSRGLVIEDSDKAAFYLTHIGYYRLSAYELPFQRADRTPHHHHFIDGTRFQQVLDYYTFDRRLRLLVMDALERIEISIKSILINEMCIPYGPHWYMDRQHFITDFNFDDFIKTIHKDIDHGKGRDRVRNVSIRHYYEAYDSPSMPPLWMVFEALTFGTVSYMYGYLPHADQKRIADRLNLGVPVLKSWLHTATILRNLCAHHARLWNRVFAFKPIAPKGSEAEFTPNTLFYAQAVMLHMLLQRVSPESGWSDRLGALIEDYPAIPSGRMGFPEDWKYRAVWTQSNT